MSARNGDKSRFHRLRKASVARRERIQALKQQLALPAKPSKDKA